MKNKVLIKFALIVLITVFCIALINTIVYSADNYSFESFEGKSADSTITTPINDVAGAILSVVRIAGTGIAIIIILVVAMKYMIAAPGERADFKKAAIQYVVGAVILFGAVNIMNLLVEVIPDLIQVSGGGSPEGGT